MCRSWKKRISRIINYYSFYRNNKMLSYNLSPSSTKISKTWRPSRMAFTTKRSSSEDNEWPKSTWVCVDVFQVIDFYLSILHILLSKGGAFCLLRRSEATNRNSSIKNIWMSGNQDDTFLSHNHFSPCHLLCAMPMATGINFGGLKFNENTTF